MNMEKNLKKRASNNQNSNKLRHSLALMETGCETRNIMALDPTKSSIALKLNTVSLPRKKYPQAHFSGEYPEEFLIQDIIQHPSQY